MSSIPQNSLDALSLRQISRLTLDRSRQRQALPSVTNVDIRKFRSGTNVIDYLKSKKVPEKVAKEFHASSKDLLEVSNGLVEFLKKLGLRDTDLKQAWQAVENISHHTRRLIDISTSGTQVNNFKNRFIELTKALGKVVFKDIMVDENIDKLSVYIRN